MCGVELLGMPAVGGVPPRRAAIVQYSSSPITNPAEGVVSPRGVGCVGGELLGMPAVGGVSPRRAATAQYTSSPTTNPAEGGISPRTQN